MIDCNTDKPKILLSFNQAGLIILCNSGVVYQNQTRGVSCMQRCAEGVLVPLLDIPCDTRQCPLEADLMSIDWSIIASLNPTIADQIDEFLHKRIPTEGLSVDREQLHLSEEAWVYVDVEPREAAEYFNFGKCKGILVWANSD